jgi:hypothetical protein
VDKTIEQQAYMMSTIDYFWLLGWGFMVLVVIIWFAKPPFIRAGAPGVRQRRGINQSEKGRYISEEGKVPFTTQPFWTQ